MQRRIPAVGGHRRSCQFTIVDGRNHSIQLRRDELDAKFPGLVDALAGHTMASDPQGHTIA